MTAHNIFVVSRSYGLPIKSMKYNAERADMKHFRQW